MAETTHSALTTTNLHVPGYRQDSDPGAVGAGRYWIDSSAGTGLWTLNVRNAADTGWETIASGGSGGATIHTSVYASPPGAPINGDVWIPSDGFALYHRISGAWVPYGPVYPLSVPPVVSGWTWVNQGGATATDVGGSILLDGTVTATSSARVLVRSAPATPYAVVACFLPIGFMVNFHSFGLLFRESGTGELHVATWTIVSGVPGLLSGKYNSPTSYSANYATVSPSLWGGPVWLRIADDGTNRICSWSPDGRAWKPYHSIARTDFLTADQVGIFVDSVNASNAASLRLLSWSVS